MAKRKADDTFILEDPTGELNDQQKLFCHEYLTLKFNGKQAAIAAGYSEKTAEVQASRLLSNAKVSEYVELLKKDLGLRLGITRERIALELAKIGFSDVGDLFTVDGAMKPLNDIKQDARGAVASVKVKQDRPTFKASITDDDVDFAAEPQGEVVEIRFWDKPAALTSLIKMLGYEPPSKVAATNAAGQDIAPITQVQIVPPPKIDED